MTSQKSMNGYFFFFCAILTYNNLPNSNLPYVISLASVTGYKKVSKCNANFIGVFIGTKLQEENSSKLLSVKGVLLNTDAIIF